MKLLIGIATYQRITKLERLLNSILSNNYPDAKIVIMADNKDIDTANYFAKEKHLIIVSDEQRYVIGSWNRFYELFHEDADAFLTLVDDVELLPGVLPKLMNLLTANFPDLDGVIGLRQLYPGYPEAGFQPAGQVLVGKKFLERFKDVKYHLCCDNYIQWYQDQELYNYSTSLNKFVLSGWDSLIHYHPAYYPQEADTTHRIVRGTIQKKDKATYQRRKELGLTWGKTWDKV